MSRCLWLALFLPLAASLLAGCATEHDPEHELTAEDQVDMGKFYFSRGKIDQAENSFRSAVSRKPKLAIAYLGLGSVYLIRGASAAAARQAQVAKQNYQFAEINFMNAIDFQPDLVDAHIGLGQLYAECKQPDLAIPCLEKARGLAQKDPMHLLRINYYLGLCRAMRMDYTGARQELNAFLAALPEKVMEKEKAQIEGLLKTIEGKADGTP